MVRSSRSSAERRHHRRDVAGHRMTDALLAPMLHQAFLLGTMELGWACSRLKASSRPAAWDRSTTRVTDGSLGRRRQDGGVRPRRRPARASAGFDRSARDRPIVPPTHLRIHDIAHHDGIDFLVMEFLKIRSLPWTRGPMTAGPGLSADDEPGHPAVGMLSPHRRTRMVMPNRVPSPPAPVTRRLRGQRPNRKPGGVRDRGAILGPWTVRRSSACCARSRKSALNT